MTPAEVDEWIAQGRRTNARHDALDREVGSLTPAEIGLGEELNCALAALACGFGFSKTDTKQAWNCVAEAYALLEPVRDRLRKEGRAR